jgi:hypothetical protein
MQNINSPINKVIFVSSQTPNNQNQINNNQNNPNKPQILYLQ